MSNEANVQAESVETRERRSFMPSSLVGGRRTIAQQLLMVMLAVIVPLLLLSALMVRQAFEGERERAGLQIRTMAGALASLLDAEFASAENLLRGLSTSDTLARRDFEAFAQEIASAGKVLRGAILVYSADGRVLFVNSRPVQGTILRDVGAISVNAEQIAHVAQSGEVAISDFFSNVNRPGVAVNVPVPPAGAAPADRLVIAAVLTPEDLGDVLARYGVTENWFAGVLDRGQRLVVRSGGQLDFTAQAIVPPLQTALRSSPSGVIRSPVLNDGEPMLLGYRRADRSGFAVVLGMPETEQSEPMRAALAQAVALGLGLSLAGLWLATRASRRLSGALRGLTRFAAYGQVASQLKRSGLAEVDQVADVLHGARLANDRAMAALRLSEARLRDRLGEIEALYRNAPIGLALLDRDGRFMRVNATLATINGFSVEQHLGRRLFDVLPYLEEKVGPVLKSVLEDGATFPHLEIERAPESPQERTRWFVMRYFPVGDDHGTVTSVGVIVEETTAQRRAEQALAQQERRLRVIVENIPSIVWTADADGKLAYVSPRWSDVTGRPGISEADWVGVLHPEDVERSRAIWERAFADSTSFDIEHRIRCRDGQYRWFLTHARPQGNELGEIWKWFGSATMIDDQKRTEHRLQAVIEEREALVREVDHRVKNSLTIVQSLLRLQMSRTDMPALREQLGEAAQRIGSVARVHDRLNIGRSASHVEAQEFFGELCADLGNVLGLGTVGRSIKATADAVMLTSQQAVSLGLAATELVTNASKYGAGEIDVSFKIHDGSEARLVVCDEGDGPTNLTPGKSSKLGMQIVSAMARQLGGSFEITHEERTCFVISFPFEESATIVLPSS